MYSKKNVFALLLAALLVLSGSGCGNGTADTVDTTENDSDPTVVDTETEETKLTPDLPEMDFGGYTFTMLTKGQYDIHWRSIDAVAEEMNGEAINDAVFDRNSKIAEQFNVTFAEMIHTDGNPTPLAQKTIQAGEDVFDVILHGNQINPLITAGMLVDLKTIPYMDLTKPWYDQNANASLSIGNKLHVTAGEMTIMDNNATWCFQFSKTLAEDLGIGDLYGMVKDGTWTMDVLKSAVEVASFDLNGDGVMTEFDQWGIEAESFDTMALMVGSGCQTFTKDEDDMPVLAIGTEHYFDTFQKAVTIIGNMDVCLYVPKYADAYPGSTIWNECMDKCFMEDRALFNFAGMNRVTLFREMETDFGILPVPKWDESQSEYRNVVSLWCAALMGVPKSAGNLERTGVILEALNAESLYTLTPAYYDITLKSKSARDEESAEMLDIIFASRVYDLGNMYGWGSVFGLPDSLNLSGADTIASKVESVKTATEKAMQQTLDAIMAE